CLVYGLLPPIAKADGEHSDGCVRPIPVLPWLSQDFPSPNKSWRGRIWPKLNLDPAQALGQILIYLHRSLRMTPASDRRSLAVDGPHRTGDQVPPRFAVS